MRIAFAWLKMGLGHHTHAEIWWTIRCCRNWVACHCGCSHGEGNYFSSFFVLIVCLFIYLFNFFLISASLLRAAFFGPRIPLVSMMIMSGEPSDNEIMQVYPAPTIAVVSTGDELVDPTVGCLTRGQVREAISRSWCLFLFLFFLLLCCWLIHIGFQIDWLVNSHIYLQRN